MVVYLVLGVYYYIYTPWVLDKDTRDKSVVRVRVVYPAVHYGRGRCGAKLDRIGNRGTMRVAGGGQYKPALHVGGLSVWSGDGREAVGALLVSRVWLRRRTALAVL